MDGHLRDKGQPQSSVFVPQPYMVLPHERGRSRLH